MKKIIYTLPLLLALGACSNEEVIAPEAPTAPVEGEGYYITFGFSVPTELGSAETRGINDVAGSEAESKITKLDLYLLDAEAAGENTVLWSKTGITDLTENTPTSGAAHDKEYTVKVALSSTGADNEVDKLCDLKGHEVKVLVVCNPDQYTGYSTWATTTAKAELQEFNLDWQSGDTYAPLGEYGTAGKAMPMANQKFLTTNFGKFKTLTQTDNELKLAVRAQFELKNGELILDLTPNSTSIDVERAVARLDLGDNGGSWIYDMKDGDNATEYKLGLYQVTPINVNKKGYVVRHGSAASEGSASAAQTLFGDGTNGFVVDPTNAFATGSWTKTIANNYINPLTVTGKVYSLPTNAVGTKAVSALTKDTQRGYYPWCYVAENTMVTSGQMSKEETATLPVNATGVYFRFKVLEKGATSMESVLNPDTSADKIPAGATIDPTTKKLTMVLTGNATYQTFDYVEADGCYYIDYVGFVTHDAPMTYGIVRNTVYQMKINSIKNFPNPENALYYLTLDINVLKWNSVDVGFDF